jgi:hypothetical protein
MSRFMLIPAPVRLIQYGQDGVPGSRQGTWLWLALFLSFLESLVVVSHEFKKKEVKENA